MSAPVANPFDALSSLIREIIDAARACDTPRDERGEYLDLAMTWNQRVREAYSFAGSKGVPFDVVGKVLSEADRMVKELVMVVLDGRKLTSIPQKQHATWSRLDDLNAYLSGRAAEGEDGSLRRGWSESRRVSDWAKLFRCGRTKMGQELARLHSEKKAVRMNRQSWKILLSQVPEKGPGANPKGQK
jgi:hypothetical protein